MAENEPTPDSEQMIEQYLKAGMTDKAFELVYGLAVSNARQKDFVKSETYRDQLYEIDSFALSQIIEVNEIIEAEKNSAILPDDRRLWANLYERLGENAANELILALRKEVYESERVILQQGQPNDNLYFITQGQVKQIYSDRDKEFFIAKLGRGDIFGDDTFFSVNVCTESLKTITPVHVGVMGRAVFEKLASGHSELGSELKKVCSAKRSVFNRLQQKRVDRRAFRRINWNTKIVFHLLDANSEKAIQSSVRAELWDISKGGLSFYFQSKSRETVRSLIGRKIGVRFDIQIEGNLKTLSLSGVVHGVQSHLMDEYSVHLQFGRVLSDAAIKTIERLSENPQTSNPAP